MATLHTTDHINTCPHCGKVHECHSGEGEEQPKPGNFSICIECLQVGVFGADMQLRLPNNEEQFFINTDPSIKHMLARYGAVLATAKASYASKKSN